MRTMVAGLLVLDVAPAIPRNDLVLWTLVAACGVAEFATMRVAAGRRRPAVSMMARNVIAQPASVT